MTLFPERLSPGPETPELADHPLPARLEEANRQRVICAWCEVVLEDGIEPMSHGMCPSCREAFLAMIPEACA
jgi:uncharacterized CHY-type Zn-finger protein